jgi:hypothetical protein
MVLSDLILGRSESGLAWSYAGEKVPLNPLNAFPKGSDAELFYEIGGLTTGAAYQIVTAVRKADDKPTAKPQVQVGFEITAAAGYERVHRSLGLGGLKPGAYVLIVTVAEAGSGQVARRERALNILPK